MRRIILGVTALFLCLLSYGVFATQPDIYTFENDEQEQLFRVLTEQLRCPQCQNNNIAESNAILSEDMRNKTFELIKQGYNKQEVIDYMVERYGHFITYDPPLTPATLSLWVIPLLPLIIGLILLLRQYRRKPFSDEDAS